IRLVYSAQEEYRPSRPYGTASAQSRAPWCTADVFMLRALWDGFVVPREAEQELHLLLLVVYPEMDGRGFGSGFSSWRGGSSRRGSGGYDFYGSKDSGRGSEGYGGGGGGGNFSGRSCISPSRTSTDDLISRINEQLDVLTEMHGRARTDSPQVPKLFHPDLMSEEQHPPSLCRFDQYESVDSRSSAFGPRDLYRSANCGYGDSRGDMMAQREGMGFGPMGGPGDGGDFDSSPSYRSPKMWQARDAFSGSGWGAGRRSQRRGGAPGGYGFGGRQDSFSVGGGGGWNRGQDKLPSLLPHRTHPKGGAFQPQFGSPDYPDRHFGGGRRANQQRGRKKPLKMKSQQNEQKKRKHSETADDEPEPKIDKTETAEGVSSQSPTKEKDGTMETGATSTASETADDGKSSVLSIEQELAQLKQKLHKKQASPSGKSDDGAADQTEESNPAGASTEQDSKPEAEGQSRVPSVEEELSRVRAKLNKPKKRRGFFDVSGARVTSRRISFACSVCKFRSFYNEDMAAHMESQFHKDVFKFLCSRIGKGTTDFLQEYLDVKHKNMEKTVSRIMNHSTAICQLYKEQDLTRDIEMEHFMKKVEAAHCAACDLYFPMQHSHIQKHLRSPDHHYNRKRLLEECKKSGLAVARSILNHKPIQEKLECYLKGENPFTDQPDDQDLKEGTGKEDPEADPTSETAEVKPEEVESASSFPAEEALETQVKQEEHEELEHKEPKIKQEEDEEAEEKEVKQETKEEEVEKGDA
ncbi:hypothetical protein NFI96_029504, partial [Prochilodus magdalenae]